MGLEIFTLPDLRPLIFSSDLQSIWPEFMRHDAAAHLYFAPSIFDLYLDYAFVGVGGQGRRSGVQRAVRFQHRRPRRTPRWRLGPGYPSAHDDKMIGRLPNALSALEISLLPEARGGGNSLALLGAMKAYAKAQGFAELFAPVRPNQKHLHPFTSMRNYVNTVRADRLPIDPWLRTHLHAGAGQDCASFHDDCWQDRRLLTLDWNVVRSIGRGLDYGRARASHGFT
jgi:GNAT superfamily N-acetyltransferase